MTVLDVRSALRAFLVADSTITAVVGSGDDARVYPIRLPQGVVQPSVVYTRVSGEGDYHTRGPSGLMRPRVQIDCWAQRVDVATSLANLVKARLDGFQGAWSYGSDSPQAEIDVHGVFLEAEREQYDDAMKLYGVSRDYFIWHQELTA
jgi:hypothetical protein